jgi:hypothetical protein
MKYTIDTAFLSRVEIVYKIVAVISECLIIDTVFLDTNKGVKLQKYILTT